MNRVTQTSMSGRVSLALQTSLARLQETQGRLATGSALGKPSDSPADTATAMRLRTEQLRTVQLQRAMDDGRAWLDTADSALATADTLVTRVRQLVIAGANGTATPSDRAAMATEVEQLRASLVEVANTQYLGRPVFAGTQDATLAYDPSTGAYLGNSSTVDRTIAPGTERLAVSVPGPEAFTTLLSDPSAPGAAGVLDRVAAALRSGSRAGLDQALTDLDTAADAVRTSQSVVGARTARLESVRSLTEARSVAALSRLDDVEGIDLAKALTDLSVQQAAYQAALAATAKVVQPSLVDFLR